MLTQAARSLICNALSGELFGRHAVPTLVFPSEGRAPPAPHNHGSAARVELPSAGRGTLRRAGDGPVRAASAGSPELAGRAELCSCSGTNAIGAVPALAIKAAKSPCLCLVGRVS